MQAMCVLHKYLCTTQDANYIPPGYVNGVGCGEKQRIGQRKDPTPPLNELDTVNRNIPGVALEIRELLKKTLLRMEAPTGSCRL